MVSAQNKATLRAAARLLASRQKAVRMATMNRAATKIKHFARSVTHMHDEERGLAARTI